VPALHVVNEVTELRRMSAWLVAEARALGVPQPLVDDLEVCANEAVMNTISYGWDDGSRHEISLRIAADTGSVSLEIEDDARPFDPFSAPEHADPASLAEAQIGGLGVRLIRRLMPASHYARRDGRNLLTLSASFASSASYASSASHG